MGISPAGDLTPGPPKNPISAICSAMTATSSVQSLARRMPVNSWLFNSLFRILLRLRYSCAHDPQERPAESSLPASCLAPLVCLSMAAQEATPPAQPETPMVLRVTTREVVLDVIARDKNHNPVGDLTESEFQVFDADKHADKSPKHILSMRVIDPHSETSHAGGHESGFSIRSGATCALSATAHYELAIRPRRTPGFTRCR